MAQQPERTYVPGPQIRGGGIVTPDEELDHLDYQMEQCAIHIRHANLQLQALRLVITN